MGDDLAAASASSVTCGAGRGNGASVDRKEGSGIGLTMTGQEPFWSREDEMVQRMGSSRDRRCESKRRSRSSCAVKTEDAYRSRRWRQNQRKLCSLAKPGGSECACVVRNSPAEQKERCNGREMLQQGP